MDPIQELRDGLAFVGAVLADIHERAGTDALSTEDQAAWDEGTAYVTATRASIETHETRARQIDELRTLAEANPTRVERGAPNPADDRRTAVTPVNVNRNADPFTEVRERGFAGLATSELIARARVAVEDHTDYHGVTDEARQGITQTLERYNPKGKTARGIAEHILMTGDADYVRGFEEYLYNPHAGPSRDMFRAAMSTTAANGGVLIPHFLDPTINLTNSGTNNVIRNISHVVQLAGSNKWEGVTSGGVTAEWIAEATQVADASPTFVGPTITPAKADAYLQASLEVIQDTGFSEITRLIVDAKDRLEETAFTTGTGSGQPYGLITRLSGAGPSVAGSSGAAGAADFVIADIYAVKNALSARFRKMAVWQSNPATYDVIRQFGNAASGTNAANFWTDLGAGTPPTLIGYASYENESMDSTRVSGSNDDILLFGDHSQYYIVDRIGMELAYNPLVMGANNRPTGEVGWVAFWRTGADVITSNAFKLLRV